MLSDREKRMAEILQRLAEWSTQMLDDHPVQVLKHIVTDAENLLVEFELPPFPEHRTSKQGTDTSDES